MTQQENESLSKAYGPGNLLWESLPSGDRVKSWSVEELQERVTELNEIVQEFLESARRQPETALQHLKTLFYHQLQALIFQVELKVSDTAAAYRTLQPHGRHSEAERQIISQHASLVRWLMQQPEWEDHARGLDVDAELPEEFYHDTVPEYLKINGSQKVTLTRPRLLSLETLSPLWTVPSSSSSENR